MTILVLSILFVVIQQVVSFTIITTTREARLSSLLSLNVSREQYLQPHFEAARPASLTALDRIIDCAVTNESYTTEDMIAMVNDLDNWTRYCGNAFTKTEECSVEAREGQEMIKKILKMKISLNQAQQQLQEMDIARVWKEQGPIDSEMYTWLNINQETQRAFGMHHELAEYESH